MQKVKVFLVRYQTPSGRKIFLPESVDFLTGNELCKRLAKSGKKPVLYRVPVEAAKFVRHGQAKRYRRKAKATG